MDTEGLDQAVRASEFPGVVVVRHAGAIVFSEAYGYATPRWQIPNTVDTRFDTASITKLFTSVAVLQQVGAGRLDLDASIHSYVDLSGTDYLRRRHPAPAAHPHQRDRRRRRRRSR